MVLEKEHEEKILEAVRKAAAPLEYGEVRIKIDKTAPRLEIVIETHEKLRIDKSHG